MSPENGGIAESTPTPTIDRRLRQPAGFAVGSQAERSLTLRGACVPSGEKRNVIEPHRDTRHSCREHHALGREVPAQGQQARNRFRVGDQRSPGHQLWQRLHRELRSGDVRCAEGPSRLGFGVLGLEWRRVQRERGNLHSSDDRSPYRHRRVRACNQGVFFPGNHSDRAEPICRDRQVQAVHAGRWKSRTVPEVGRHRPLVEWNQRTNLQRQQRLQSEVPGLVVTAEDARVALRSTV